MATYALCITPLNSFIYLMREYFAFVYCARRLWLLELLFACERSALKVIHERQRCERRLNLFVYETSRVISLMRKWHKLYNTKVSTQYLSLTPLILYTSLQV